VQQSDQSGGIYNCRAYKREALNRGSILTKYVCTYTCIRTWWVTLRNVVTNSWQKLLGKHKQIAAVFLDVRKAFDSIPHHMLIKSLSSIGIQGSLLLWLQNYLTSRSQRVVLDGFSSDPVAVTSGVPQGSILCPLLFNIFMNFISTVPLSANCHLALYADDILIYNSTDLSTFQNDVQINWICDNGLTPNHTKTQLLPITRSRRQSLLSISINGYTISPCQSVKYLGVTLTQNLTWSQHIGNICESSKKQLGLIHPQLRHAPSKLHHQIYRTTTLPRLEYCCAVRDPHHQVHKRSLKSVQKFAARIITTDWKADYPSLCAKLNMKTPATRRINKMKVCYIVNNLSCHPSPPSATMAHQYSFFIDVIPH